MATNRKPAKQAKKRTGKPAAQLPATLEVRVRWTPDQYTARALGLSCTCTSSDMLAVRGLAAKLGYSTGADVRYLRTEEGGARPPKVFQVVEVGRAG